MRKRSSLIVLLHQYKLFCPFKQIKKKKNRKYELINLVTERVRPLVRGARGGEEFVAKHFLELFGGRI